ncbi:MAG: hypothetical protein AAF573_08260 [Bacteroidota bacterium]
MNHKKKYTVPIAIIAFMLISILHPSCIEDKLGQEMEFKAQVDTLFNRRIKTFNEELDSICALKMDSLIEYNVDSIKRKRLEAIEKLTRQ